MKRGKNLSFLENYILLERAADNLMKKGGGVGAYIAALERQKLDTGAADTLKFLKKSKSVRNRLAHDPGAIKETSDITSSDIKRIKKLTALIKKGKDPLSRIEKNKKESRKNKIKTALIITAALTLIAAALILYGR